MNVKEIRQTPTMLLTLPQRLVWDLITPLPSWTARVTVDQVVRLGG